MEKKARVLLVEDDRNLAFVIKDNLEINGFQVTHCLDGEAAFQQFSENNFDLCVFDVMLPKKDGITLASDIRKQNTIVPILFLTAKSMKDDRIAGFKAGGDDYITKPFSIEELLLRMEVFLKRSRVNNFSDTSRFSLGKVEFDADNLLLNINGDSINLTQKEAEILKMLCLHRNKVLKREEILKQVWGNDDYFTGRSLDVFITKLRKHLKREEGVEIVNVHGVGFKLQV